MSGSDRVSREEFSRLRADLDLALDRIGELEEGLAALSLRARDQGAVAAPVTVNYTFASGSEQPPAAPTTSASTSPPGITDAERREAAVAVGHFFRQALDGRALEPPRAHRAKLPARCYILCRDKSGRDYNPVQFHRSFSSLKPLVREGEYLANASAFAGFPTQWEARVAVQTAGLNWPADGA